MGSNYLYYYIEYFPLANKATIWACDYLFMPELKLIHVNKVAQGFGTIESDEKVKL